MQRKQGFTFRPLHFFGGCLGGAFVAFVLILYILPAIDGLDDEANSIRWSHHQLVIARDDCYHATLDQLDNGELDEVLASYNVPLVLGEEWISAYCSSRARTYQLFGTFEQYELAPIEMWSRYAQTDFVQHDLSEATALVRATY